MKPVSYRIIAQTTLIVTACSREEAESSAFVHITTAPPVKKTRKPRRRKGEPADTTATAIETSVKLVAAEVVSTCEGYSMTSERESELMLRITKEADTQLRSFQSVPMNAGNSDCPNMETFAGKIEHKFEPASLSSP